jgi:hypothetical protein
LDYPALSVGLEEDLPNSATKSVLVDKNNLLNLDTEFQDEELAKSKSLSSSSYTNSNTDFTEKFFVRVDVTEEFPFLVTKMSPYYDR